MKRIGVLLFLAIIFSGCKGKYYRMSTQSMENTIMLRDRFYVSYTNKFSRNDIVAFDIFCDDYSSGPDDNGQFKKHWESRAYRLIALSGDKVEIKGNEVFINDKRISLPPGAKHLYDVDAKKMIEEFEKEEAYFSGLRRAGDTFKYMVPLSKDDVKHLESRDKEIFRVTPHINNPGDLPDTFFARISAAVKWDAYNYGPLYIPKPGETITVNPDNYKLYQNIPGIKMGENKITEALYFVLGDNRHFAQDSRYIGYISHSKMFGIVR